MSNLKKELADLKERLAKLEEQVKKQDNKSKSGEIWKPKKDEDYYTVDGDGSIYNFSNTYDDGEDPYIDNGNYYRTKEEAEFEAQCEKYTRLYRKYVEKHSEPLDWKDSAQDKWYAIYDFQTNSILYDWADGATDMNIFANNKQILEDAIEFIGKDNFKKYVLRVEEKDNAEN